MTDPAAVLAALNDDQRQAATYRGGPLLILAGAGTGKTGTLVARAQPPDTDNAADRIVGGTFHAIAHRIIRAHSEAFALPPEFSVLMVTQAIGRDQGLSQTRPFIAWAEKNASVLS